MILAVLRALALLPALGLVTSVDRTPSRSLLKRGQKARQPVSAWTIIRNGWVFPPIADGCTDAQVSVGVLGIHDTKSRDTIPVESPMEGMPAETDEERALDQRCAARNARRNPGGRRAC
jgi:hypothetical protein